MKVITNTPESYTVEMRIGAAFVAHAIAYGLFGAVAFGLAVAVRSAVSLAGAALPLWAAFLGVAVIMVAVSTGAGAAATITFGDPGDCADD